VTLNGLRWDGAGEGPSTTAEAGPHRADWLAVHWATGRIARARKTTYCNFLMRVFLLGFRFVMVVGAASIMSTWNCEVIAAAFASAAVEPSLWVQAMDVIASETESEGALLMPLRGAISNVPVSGSIRKATEKYFREGCNTRDERFRAIETMVRRGVADDFDFMTSEEMKRHPYYQDFLRPVGLQYFAGIKMTAGDDLWCVSLQRSPQQGPFSTDEKERLAALSPRLSSAATLARALGFAAINGAIEAFEVAGSAIVLLNRCAEVLRLNKAAEALLGGRTGTQPANWTAPSVPCCTIRPNPR
jgi:hypothetical protein